MRKLIYWVAPVRNDHPAYNRRYRRLKDARAAADERGCDYGKPHKVTIEYHDAFDLLSKCLGEGSIDEGN